MFIFRDIAMRLLMDRGELGAQAGRIMIALTLVEDLAAAIPTVALPSRAPRRRLADVPRLNAAHLPMALDGNGAT